MKTILLTATYLVGIGELVLAIFFWMTHSKSEIRKVMALLALSTGLWVILSAFTAYKSDLGLTAFANNLIFVAGATLVTSMLHLTLIFPYPVIRLDWLHKLLFYVPVLIFSAASFFTKALQIGATGNANFVGKIVQGPAYPVYNLYLLSLYIISIYILFLRRKKLDGRHLANNNLFLLGLTLGGLPAVYVDLIAPIFFSQFEFNYVFGVLFTGLWLGATVKIIAQK